MYYILIGMIQERVKMMVQRREGRVAGVLFLCG